MDLSFNRLTLASIADAFKAADAVNARFFQPVIYDQFGRPYPSRNEVAKIGTTINVRRPVRFEVK